MIPKKEFLSRLIAGDWRPFLKANNKSGGQMENASNSEEINADRVLEIL